MDPPSSTLRLGDIPPNVMLALLGLAGIGVPLAYVLYQNGGVDFRELSERMLALTTVDETDLMAVLPPWGSYAQENDSDDGLYVGGGTVNRSGIRLPCPASTVVLGWEGTCLDVHYDVKAGYVPEFRPGLAHLFLSLAAADTEVVLWSSIQQTDQFRQQLHKFLQSSVIPLDNSRYEAFQGFLEANYTRALAVEAGIAAKEGRAPRPMFPITTEDRLDLYAENVLRWVAVLGKEHCVASSTRNIRPVNLVAVPRAPWDVVAIDCTPPLELGLEETQIVRSDASAGPTYLGIPRFSTAPPRVMIEGEMMPKMSEGKKMEDKKVSDFTLFMLAELFSGFSSWRGEKEKGVRELLDESNGTSPASPPLQANAESSKRARKEGGVAIGDIAAPPNSSATAQMSISAYLDEKARLGSSVIREGLKSTSQSGTASDYSRAVFCALKRELKQKLRNGAPLENIKKLK